MRPRAVRPATIHRGQSTRRFSLKEHEEDLALPFLKHHHGEKPTVRAHLLCGFQGIFTVHGRCSFLGLNVWDIFSGDNTTIPTVESHKTGCRASLRACLVWIRWVC